jgi:RHS repeat-associated protein
VADGADWIWNLAHDPFPDSVEIVDWYHATEYLAHAAEALYPSNPETDSNLQQLTAYNTAGQVISITEGYGTSLARTTYTQEDLITVTSYDAAGNHIGAKDPNSVVTQYQYDLLNRLTAVTENYVLSGPTTPITNVLTVYTYTVAGGLANIQDGRGKLNSFTYDLLDRQVSATDPLAHTTVYTYNETGDRIVILDPNGQVTSYAYDLLDRQTAITYPAGTPSVTFAYDALSQRTVMTDGTGATTWTFDAVGRPITITQPNVGNVGYGYDSAGDRTGLSYPDGKVVTYTYDLAARLANVTDWQAKTTNYSYNALGQPITVTLPNGVTSRYSYDNAGRVAVISHTTLTQTLAVYTYTVDAIGNRTQVVEGSLINSTQIVTSSHNSIASGSMASSGTRGSVTAFTGGSAVLAFTHIHRTTTSQFSSVTINYTYDPLYRLAAANYSTGQVYTYTYDAVGNRLGDGGPAGAKVYTYDDANRLGTINGTTTQTWDNNGNLLNNGAGVTYTYDAENRLLALNASLYTYAYDGLGDRVLQIVSGSPITYTLDQAAGLTQVLAETTGALTTMYAYGDARLAQQTSTGTDYFLPDALGSVRQLANASAIITLRKSYDPFGQAVSSTGTHSTNYDFTGEYKDASSMLYLRARYYAAYLNQFIQPDTIVPNWRDPRTLNRYVYVKDSPINSTDPSGHDPWWCKDAACDVNYMMSITPSPTDRALELMQYRYRTSPGLFYAGLPSSEQSILSQGGVTEGMFNDAQMGGAIDVTDRQQDLETIASGVLGCKIGITLLSDILDALSSAPAVDPAANLRAQGSNAIGTWGVNQVGEQLPVDTAQFRMYNANGDVERIYDGRFLGSTDSYVEIKTSTYSTMNLKDAIRDEIAYDANMVPKPLWIFVNTKPSGPFLALLQRSGIPWHELHVRWP